MNAPILPPANPDFPPAADDLEVDNSFAASVDADHGPRFNYRLRRNNHDAQEAIARAVDEAGNVVSEGRPASPDTFKILSEGICYMTRAQWDDWQTQGDERYILECVAGNLGLELVPVA